MNYTEAAAKPANDNWDFKCWKIGTQNQNMYKIGPALQYEHFPVQNNVDLTTRKRQLRIRGTAVYWAIAGGRVHSL